MLFKNLRNVKKSRGKMHKSLIDFFLEFEGQHIPNWNCADITFKSFEFVPLEYILPLKLIFLGLINGIWLA